MKKAAKASARGPCEAKRGIVLAFRGTPQRRDGSKTTAAESHCGMCRKMAGLIALDSYTGDIVEKLIDELIDDYNRSRAAH